MFFHTIKTMVGNSFSIRRLGRWRRIVQACYGIFCIYAGYRFYLYYLWAIGNSQVYVERPPAVEAFLPISALVSLKRFVLTGNYDQVHPAGLTIFLAALIIGLLWRRGFCGWICPVGFLSELVSSAGARLRLLPPMPPFIDYPLLSLKYLLLVFFSYFVLWQMGISAIEGFVSSPYNMVVDAKMLLFFLAPSQATILVLAALVALSLCWRYFWCRYLCPYGALLGLLALASPLRIKREAANCIECGRCEKSCPVAIKVWGKNEVRTAECIGCLECAAVCPAKDCLSLAAGRRQVFPYFLPAAIIGTLLLLWLIALATGHWYSLIAPESFRDLYQQALTLQHPRTF